MPEPTVRDPREVERQLADAEEERKRQADAHALTLTNSPEAAAARLLGVRPSEVAKVEPWGSRTMVTTTDAQRYVIVPPDDPDAKGRYGVMLAIGHYRMVGPTYENVDTGEAFVRRQIPARMVPTSSLPVYSCRSGEVLPSQDGGWLDALKAGRWGRKGPKPTQKAKKSAGPAIDPERFRRQVAFLEGEVAAFVAEQVRLGTAIQDADGIRWVRDSSERQYKALAHQVTIARRGLAGAELELSPPEPQPWEKRLHRDAVRWARAVLAEETAGAFAIQLANPMMATFQPWMAEAELAASLRWLKAKGLDEKGDA